ncbi:MAG: hypothetical protein ACMG6E_03300, partial [Candidatus Roizmanbacteria bacterium]
MHTKRSGEIATTIAILSLITMLLGSFIGTQIASRQNLQKTTSKATVLCENYSYTISVKEEGSSDLITQDKNGNKALTAANDRTGIPEFLPLGTIHRDLGGISPYQEGDTGSVTLGQVDPKWEIVGTYCTDENPLKKVCPSNPNQKSANFSGFHPTCGGSPNYGWILRDRNKDVTPPIQLPTRTPTQVSADPTPTSSTRPSPTLVRPSPTGIATNPQPTSKPGFCHYYSEAIVIKESNRQALTKTENDEYLQAGETPRPWGVSNGLQNQTIPIGVFGVQDYNHVKTTIWPKLAIYQYNNDNHPFGLPGQYKEGELASVRLIGLGNTWEIVDTICDDRGSTNGAEPCKRYSQSISDPTRLDDIKLNCGLNMRYG